MIRLIQWLIFGHVHKWKEVERVKYRTDYIDTGEYSTGRRVYCVCETCGAQKRWNLT